MSCRVTVWIGGLNRLCQSSYVTTPSCPAPDRIRGIKNVAVWHLPGFECMSYFGKERAYDGLLLQPALLTLDHRRLRFRIANTDVSWFYRKSTLGSCFRSRQGSFSLPVCLHMPHLLSDVHRLPESLLTSLSKKKTAQLVASHQRWAFGCTKRLKCFYPSMGYMCRRREQARWQNRSRMHGIVVCRGYCGRRRRRWFLPVWLLDVRVRSHLWEEIKDQCN